MLEILTHYCEYNPQSCEILLNLLQIYPSVLHAISLCSGAAFRKGCTTVQH